MEPRTPYLIRFSRPFELRITLSPNQSSTFESTGSDLFRSQTLKPMLVLTKFQFPLFVLQIPASCRALSALMFICAVIKVSTQAQISYAGVVLNEV